MSLSKADLINFLTAEGYKVNKRNNTIWINCPVHGDRNPSLNINITNKGVLWFCFGCQKGGGLLTLLDFLGKKPEDIGLSGQDKRKILPKYYGPHDILERSHYSLLHTPLAMKYLIEERGFRKDEINSSNIGYIPKGNNLFGLGGRIIFPLVDVNKETKGFIGRSISSKEERKYLFMRGSKLKEWIYLTPIKSSSVVVCEGPLDALMSYLRLNITGIATLTNRVFQKQVEIIAQLNPVKIYYQPDTDPEGITNIVDNLAQLLRIGKPILIGQIEDKDLHGSLINNRKPIWQTLEKFLASSTQKQRNKILESAVGYYAKLLRLKFNQANRLNKNINLLKEKYCLS